MKFTKAIELKNNWLLKKINNKWWKIEDQFIWYIDYQDKEECVIVPEWFITNFWSIPKILRGFLDFTSLWYILHDYLYAKEWKLLLTDSEIQVPITRSYADMVLRDALKVEWIWFIKRWLVWIWVRLFWFLFYKK